MSYTLKFEPLTAIHKIELPKSKSIANRLLIIQALSDHQIEIQGLSNAEDTKILRSALAKKGELVSVGLAGTAYRFLTAFFALVGNREVILDGSERMRERPIKILVDVLKELNAEIEYLGQEGYPPLRIIGRGLAGGKISIDGSVSSQYISALLLIGPYLESDLRVNLVGRLVSLPYIDLTLSLMRSAGVEALREKNEIIIRKGVYHSERILDVEVDWSAAAFFYQFVALSGLTILLKDLSLNSIQGDRSTAKHFKKLGVETTATNEGLLLTRVKIPNNEWIEFDLVDCPDLIPAIAVTSSQLIEKTIIRGASTLRIKESNRVEALKNELSKINSIVLDLEEDFFEVQKSEKIKKIPFFETHHDHRMAMCLAPLVCLIPQLIINNPEVVLKSFPSFWEEIKKLGVQVN